jgi:microcystin-dependent protein
MNEPMIGEIRMFAFGQAPSGWLLCDGSTHKIERYEQLFMLINTTYGGDGGDTFGVPDLRGRVPLHKGKASASGSTERRLGQGGGSEQVALQVAHLPVHSHSYKVSTALASSAAPKDLLLARPTNNDGIYLKPEDAAGLTPRSTASATIPALSTGAIAALHDNMMPTLTLSYCIAAHGIFPSRQA